MKIQKFMGRALLASLFLVISCGREEQSVRNLDTERAPENSQLSKRFSDAEIAQVYTNESPETQTEVIQNEYTPQNAPAAFKAEWGDFTKAVEMKGFVNMTQTPTGGEPNDDPTARAIVGTLQAFSKWKEIKKKDGRPLLDDAYTTDSWGDKQPDITNGKFRRNPDTHYGKVVGSSLGIGLELVFSKQAAGQINADIYNPKAISVFPFGTVVKAKGVKIRVEFFPYKNGWLFYTAATPKLEKFQDKADDLTEIAESILHWLRKKVGK